MNYTQVLYEILVLGETSVEIQNSLQKEKIIEKLYSYASQHQLLPCLYNTIIKNNLTKYFPDDFIEAIKYFKKLNLERNNDILKQVSTISELFKNNNIEHCFLKGVALLILNPYEDISSRMVGDIDMLIKPSHLHKANKLLISNGYIAFETSPDPVYKNHRHLPRLVNEEFIAAVELHDKLLEKSQTILLPNNILKDKQIFNGYFIPSKTHLKYHSIFNHQINDEAYHLWDFSFKTLFDVLSLIHKTNEKIDSETKNKYIRRFWLIASLYINDIKVEPTFLEQIKIYFLKLRLKYQGFNKFYSKLIYLWNRKHTFFTRAWYFLTNKTYRDYLLNKPG